MTVTFLTPSRLWALKEAENPWIPWDVASARLTEQRP